MQQAAALLPWLQSELGDAARELVTPTPADLDRWVDRLRDAFHAQPDQLRTLELDAAASLGSRQRAARKSGRWRAFLDAQYGGKDGLRRELAACAGGSSLPRPLTLGSHNPEGPRSGVAHRRSAGGGHEAQAAGRSASLASSGALVQTTQAAGMGASLASSGAGTAPAAAVESVPALRVLLPSCHEFCSVLNILHGSLVSSGARVVRRFLNKNVVVARCAAWS